MGSEFRFKTRARLINQIGEQLIKNESIALLELIKNSYDADATKCTVSMTKPDDTHSGKIIIEDDGEGIAYQNITAAWLEIGTSLKADLNVSKNNNRTKKFNRARLGEKGIGRFGIHKLGKKVEIITRGLEIPDGIPEKKETVLNINWSDIDSITYIEDMPVTITKRTPEIFTNGTGTKIIIADLKTEWSRKLVRECFRSITSLNSPFESVETFRVKFETGEKSLLRDLLSFDDIQNYKLFSFDLVLEGNEIIKFNYEFMPWDTMKKLKIRKISIDDREIKSLKRLIYKEERNYIDIDLAKYKIGKVRFKGFIFDRDARTLDLGVQDRAGLKEYLNKNGGIQVFRDNMRVFDYGEPGHDWLNLGGRRINIPAKRISNNIILAAVYLDRIESADLKEKASREGFIENDAYQELLKALNVSIVRIESLRKTDKDLLRKYYGPQKISEPVITSIAELKAIVDKNIKSDDTKKEIHRYLDRIEGEYKEITTSLIKSAGAGLNLIFVIHQMEKIVKELSVMLKKNASTDTITGRVTTLASLVEGYSILIKKSEKKNRNIKGIIDNCIFNIKFRLDIHEIKLVADYKNVMKNLDAICSEDHVLNALMNLFDNSIWWLGYGKVKDPTIWLTISDELKNYTSIVLADNGPGFSKPTDEIIKPFVSDKPGGMGIGLHLTEQIMKALDGKLLFPEMEIFSIPDEYKSGAKIALAFKK